jgi:hypothetical protein
MKKPSLAICIALCSTPAFSMFCPTGFNQMNLGDTIDQVTQQCGKPDTQIEKKEEPSQPQEWVYYVKPDPSQSGTLKLSIAFDADKKIINMTMSDMSIMNTPICGPAVQVGDTADSVKKSCGDPAFVNKGMPQGKTSQPILITEFVYNTNPPTTLIFENGQLKERK